MTANSLLMLRPLSLTSRVMVFVALAVGFSLITIAYLLQDSVERHFAQQDADELTVINLAVEQALQAATVPHAEMSATLARAVSGHHGVYFQVWDQQGQLRYGPSSVNFSTQIKTYSPLERIAAEGLYRWHTDGRTFRGIVSTARIGGENFTIVAAIDMSFHLSFLDYFQRSLWMIMALAGAITLVAAWYGIHKGLAPLRVLSDAIRDVHADRLHLRLDSDAVPAELTTLVDSSNRMLSKLEESFSRLSHFSADIAHELRTPLTNLTTQTQVCLGKSRSAVEYRELLYSNLEEYERLTKMLNDMLWLAQSERGLLRPLREPLNLTQEVQGVFDFFEALAEDKGVELKLEGEAVTILGDRSFLRRILSNLVSNALRYTPPGHEIRVKTGLSYGREVVLCVENTGSEISPEHLTRIFDRFYRADPSRSQSCEGAGLGLAIVKSIVEAEGGRIDVFSELGVTRFTMCFLNLATMHPVHQPAS